MLSRSISARAKKATFTAFWRPPWPDTSRRAGRHLIGWRDPSRLCVGKSLRDRRVERHQFAFPLLDQTHTFAKNFVVRAKATGGNEALDDAFQIPTSDTVGHDARFGFEVRVPLRK